MTQITLTAGPTSLERLQGALGRLVQKHGFLTVDREIYEFPAGPAVLLLTEDPQRNPEVLDACVILPEALKEAGGGIVGLAAGPELSVALLQRFGATRAPAVVFLKDGQFAGLLQGIRDWNEYRAEVERLLAAPPQPAYAKKAVGIPVRSETASGACS